MVDLVYTGNANGAWVRSAGPDSCLSSHKTYSVRVAPRPWSWQWWEIRSLDGPVHWTPAAVTGAAGLPMPEIEDDGGVVTVRFRHGIELRATAEFGPMTGSANLSLSRRVLALLDRADQGLARREIHARLGSGASERQVRRALEELRDKGLVVSTNRGPLALWRRSQGHDGGAIGANGGPLGSD